jgi:hypothetical protein
VADLQEIVDDLEADLRRPISVEDRRWRLLAHSAQPDEADPVRRTSILTRETPPDVAAWLEGLGLQRARELVDLPENEALGMTRRACLPLRHGDVLLGFLWVIVGERPLTDAERETIVRGGAAVADALWSRLREGDKRQSVVRALVAGEPGATADLGWPPVGAYAIAVLHGDDDVPERLRRRRGAAELAYATGERLIILARSPSGFREALETAGATGGLSELSHLDDAQAAHRRAAIAALCVRARPSLGPVASYADLGSWAQVATLWIDAGRPAPPYWLTDLAMQRRGWQLIEALEALLDAGGDYAEAARTLGLHRATLYRRLERVERITGLDLSRGDDRLLAHLSLRLFRLGPY